MANVSVSNITLSAIVSVTVSVASYSASASYTDVIYSTDGASVSYNYELIETRPLPSVSVSVSELISKQANKSPSDDVTVTETEVKNINVGASDSVTAQEALFKIVTNPIDFDPTDDDVDPTPVTISELAAKTLTIGELSDNDDVTASESISKQPNKSPSDSIAASEQLNSFHFGKTFSDTAASSEEINRIDVTTVLADDVTVTESSAKNITPAGKTDDVTMTGSQIKIFSANVDFDLSDADADPDPVTASDQVNTVSIGKNPSDTASIAESTAKNITHGGFSDTASITESTAKVVTLPGVTDSLTAVEGIKLEPSKPFGHSVSASESVALNPRPVFSHAVSATESINTSLILGESTYLYPDFVVASDGSETGKLPGYHIGTGRIRAITSPDFGYQLNEELGMFNEGVVFGTGIDGISYTNKIFVQDRARHRVADISATLGHNDSLLNTAPLSDAVNDSVARTHFTGVLGAAEQINMAILNSDTITYGDETNAGLIVNFMYTDTQDPELGGHYLNETPLCAGAY
jgi:hypothetical protein